MDDNDLDIGEAAFIDVKEVDSPTKMAAAAVVTTSPVVPVVERVVVEKKYVNGDVYSGLAEPRNEIPSGMGVYVDAVTKDKTEGEFANGMLHGMGTLSRSNGDKYAGRFAQDRFENGSYTYGNNQHSENPAVRYRGTFRENLPNGTGILEFANGDVYEGSIEAGRVKGNGRYATAAGDIIAGSFEDGRPTRGVKLCAAGHKYVGEFHPLLPGSRFHGLGRLEFINGDSYEGYFENGYFNGEGSYTFSDGMMISCNTWINDEPTGPVDIILPDGSYFSGAFFADRRHLVEGRGVMKFSDGSWFEARSFRRVGVMPFDRDGGAFYFDKKIEAKSWLTLECGHFQGNSSLVWLCLAGYQSLGLQFSSVNPSQEDTSGAKLMLSIHQNIQFALSSAIVPKEDFLWVNLGEDEKYPRVQLVLKCVSAIHVGEASRSFCLVGPHGSNIDGNSDQTILFEAKKVAENLGSRRVVLLDFGKQENDSVCLRVVAEGDNVRKFPKEKVREVVERDLQNLVRLQPDFVVLLLTTGYVAALDVKWLIYELIRIQPRVVIAWVNGNPKSPIETSTACALSVIELVSKS
jgi:hypothetical protein